MIMVLRALEGGREATSAFVAGGSKRSTVREAVMSNRPVFLLAVLVLTGAFEASAVVHTPEEDAKLATLASEIGGAILYTTGGQVYKLTIGDWDNAVSLGNGNYARWSPDGTKIAVLYQGTLVVMNADGSSPQTVTGGLTWNINPIAYHPNMTDIVYTQTNYGMQLIKISDGTKSALATYHKYFGEPSVSRDGKRLTSRVSHDLYAITPGVGDRKYVGGACSPGVSPDSAYLLNNTGAHTTAQIRDWDGSNMFTLSAATCVPDLQWDTMQWSNHPNYLAVQGDPLSSGGVTQDIYIMKISADIGTRVTWVGNCNYPDLHVDNVFSIKGLITMQGTGTPVPNRKIVATGTQTIETQTNDSGEYMIIGLLAGNYTISAPGYTIAPAAPVTVSGSNVTGANFVVTAQDTDFDSLPDDWEQKYFGDLTSTDGSIDSDGDGIIDSVEYTNGTNPTIPEATGGGGGGCGGGVWAGLVILLVAARLLSRRRVTAR